MARPQYSSLLKSRRAVDVSCKEESDKEAVRTCEQAKYNQSISRKIHEEVKQSQESGIAASAQLGFCISQATGEFAIRSGPSEDTSRNIVGIQFFESECRKQSGRCLFYLTEKASLFLPIFKMDRAVEQRTRQNGHF